MSLGSTARPIGRTRPTAAYSSPRMPKAGSCFAGRSSRYSPPQKGEGDDGCRDLLGHRRARYRNPESGHRPETAAARDYCDVHDGLSVLDVGCGKAWVMRQWAERFAITGTGLETNRHFIE